VVFFATEKESSISLWYYATEMESMISSVAIALLII